MVVVLDKGGNLRLEIARQLVVFEQDAVPERLMPTLDLALGLRMTWRTAQMLDVSLAKPFRQIARDVGWAIVGQQSRPMDDVDLSQSRRLERKVQRVCDILGLHRRAQLPRDDVAREVVENGA